MRDIEFLRQSLKAELKSKPMDRFLFELVTNYDEIGRELWRIYRTTTHDAVRLGALNRLAELKEKKAKILQDLGVLEKAAEKLDQNIVVRWKDDDS